MSNVIEFKAKPKGEAPAAHMFTMTMYQDANGMYEVEMDADESVSDWDIYVALECVAARYAEDHGFLTVDIESEIEDQRDELEEQRLEIERQHDDIKNR